jgi:hypothetical protein
MHMRKFIALFLVASVSVSPALAQTYGVSGFATGFGGSAPSPSVVNAGFSTPTTAGLWAQTPNNSFFSADAQAQMTAHKARWARIEAKKRLQAKAQ